MTPNSSSESNPNDGPDSDSGDEREVAIEEGTIVENSTIESATVVIHAHPRQTPVEIITESFDIHVIANTCRLNGVEYSNPDRPLTITGASVTHDPRTAELDIRTQ